MRNSSKASIAIIGGSGLECLTDHSRVVRVGSPYGLPPSITIGEIDGNKVAFLPRHGPTHSVPPHRINYRANISALHQLGVKRVFATNAVGGIDQRLNPGDLVVPKDFVDFTKGRSTTFYNQSPVTHVDMTDPYCPEIRKALMDAVIRKGETVWGEAVLACMEGPRYETPAEIRMLRSLGCDVVGMTSMPETILAKELEMCYASLCYVSNMAVGLQDRQTVGELRETAEKKRVLVQQILKDAVSSLPKARNCACSHALDDARI